MKKLVASLVVLAVIGSSNVLASNLAEGFNWPDGFSSTDQSAHQIDTKKDYGFNWPEGMSFESDVATSQLTNVAYGLNWPEGS